MNSPRSPLVLILIPLVCLLLGSCSHRVDDKPVPRVAEAEDFARETQKNILVAQDFTFDLGIRIKPEQGESLRFTLMAWHGRDGRVRIRGSKRGVEFMEGLVQRDGAFNLTLPREKRVVRSSLSALAAAIERRGVVGGGVFARLRTFTNDLRYGAVTPSSRMRFVDDPDQPTGPQLLEVPGDRGTTATIRFKTYETFEVPAEKVVSNRVGTELYRLIYSDYQTYDKLLRPKYTELKVVDDPTLYKLRIRALDIVPSIDARYWNLPTPSEWPEMSVDEFIDLLVE